VSDAARILVVEDERPIREGLRDHFQREGWEVSCAETVCEAERCLYEQPDLVILDRKLPDGDGLQVLQVLRTQGMTTPVIVLSAKGEAVHRIEGLEGGADDYVTKPFHLRELVARIRAVLGRSGGARTEERSQIGFGDHVLDVGARTLSRGRKQVAVTKLEFDLLLYLVRNSDRAISRNELLDRVWGYDKFPTTRTVDYHILSLRKKIEPDPENPRHIITVHRVGYRFER